MNIVNLTTQSKHIKVQIQIKCQRKVEARSLRITILMGEAMRMSLNLNRSFAVGMVHGQLVHK